MATYGTHHLEVPDGSDRASAMVAFSQFTDTLDPVLESIADQADNAANGVSDVSASYGSLSATVNTHSSQIAATNTNVVNLTTKVNTPVTSACIAVGGGQVGASQWISSGFATITNAPPGLYLVSFEGLFRLPVGQTDVWANLATEYSQGVAQSGQNIIARVPATVTGEWKIPATLSYFINHTNVSTISSRLDFGFGGNTIGLEPWSRILLLRIPTG